jgi:hypothetical protein
LFITGNTIQQNGGELTLGNASSATNIGNLSIYGNELHHYITDTGDITIGTLQTSGRINLGNNATRTATGTIYIGTGNTARTQLGNLVVHGNTLHHVNTTGNLDIGTGLTNGTINIGTQSTRTGQIFIGTGSTFTTEIGNIMIQGSTIYAVGDTMNIGNNTDNILLNRIVQMSVLDSTGSNSYSLITRGNGAGLYQITTAGTTNIVANAHQHDTMLLVGYSTPTGVTIQFAVGTVGIRSNWRCTIFNHSAFSVTVTNANVTELRFVGTGLSRGGVATITIATNTSKNFRIMGGLAGNCIPPSNLTALIYVE